MKFVLPHEVIQDVLCDNWHVKYLNRIIGYYIPDLLNEPAKRGFKEDHYIVEMALPWGMIRWQIQQATLD